MSEAVDPASDKQKEACLTLLALNPVRKVRFFALAKAFMFWARDFNNAVQIEELTKQVQERTKVLRTVREAYMRDVIGIKATYEQHLRKLQLPPPDELAALPTTDLRAYIQETIAQIPQNQLRAALAQKFAALGNPWMQSKAFDVHYADPDAKQTAEQERSLPLFAPGKMVLYVRHCKACVGVMKLIHRWNQDVEKALDIVYDPRDKIENQRLQETVHRLLNTIANQESELLELREHLHTCTAGEKWLEERSTRQSLMNQVQRLEENLRRRIEVSHMTAADAHARALEFRAKTLMAEQKLRAEVQQARAVSEELALANGDKEDEIERLALQLQRLQDHTAELESRCATHCETIVAKEKQAEALQVSNAQLREDFAALREVFEESKRAAADRVEELSSMLEDETSRCEQLERMLDEEREQTQNARTEAADCNQRLHLSHERCTQLAQQMEMLAMQNCELQQRLVDALLAKDAYKHQAELLKGEVAQARSKAPTSLWSRALQRTKANARLEARRKRSIMSSARGSVSGVGDVESAVTPRENAPAESTRPTVAPLAAVGSSSAVAGFGGVIHTGAAVYRGDDQLSSVASARTESSSARSSTAPMPDELHSARRSLQSISEHGSSVLDHRRASWSDTSSVLTMPPPTFKAVAFAALFAVRFSRAIRSQDIRKAWPFGVRRHQRRLLQYQQQVTEIDNKRIMAEAKLQQATLQHEKIIASKEKAIAGIRGQCRALTLLLKSCYGLVHWVASQAAKFLARIRMWARLQQRASGWQDALETEPAPVLSFSAVARLVHSFIRDSSVQLPNYSNVSRTMAARVVLAEEALHRLFSGATQMVDEAIEGSRATHEKLWAVMVAARKPPTEDREVQAAAACQSVHAQTVWPPASPKPISVATTPAVPSLPPQQQAEAVEQPAAVEQLATDRTAEIAVVVEAEHLDSHRQPVQPSGDVDRLEAALSASMVELARLQAAQQQLLSEGNELRVTLEEQEQKIATLGASVSELTNMNQQLRVALQDSYRAHMGLARKPPRFVDKSTQAACASCALHARRTGSLNQYKELVGDAQSDDMSHDQLLTPKHVREKTVAAQFGPKAAAVWELYMRDMNATTKKRPSSSRGTTTKRSLPTLFADGRIAGPRKGVGSTLHSVAASISHQIALSELKGSDQRLRNLTPRPSTQRLEDDEERLFYQERGGAHARNARPATAPTRRSAVLDVGS